METKWYQINGRRIRVRYSEQSIGFLAKIYGNNGECQRGVIGSYPTPEDARNAAELLMAMDCDERLATPADIDRVRRENKARLTHD